MSNKELENLYKSMTDEQLERTLVGMQEQIVYLVMELKGRRPKRGVKP
jgi:hypothetical protein